MQLTKNQIEAVRYQLKKLNATAGNDQIRETAESFQEFDAVAIAQKITDQSSSLVIPEVASTLSKQVKTEIVQKQVEFLGIELNQNEIKTIVSQSDPAISDTLDFLGEVQGLIKQFLARRNKQFELRATQAVQDIAGIINESEAELAQIVVGTNERLTKIVNGCKEAAQTDYKSAYRNRLQGIRETLEVPTI